MPCTDPANEGIGCFCETAGILCSTDDLDGFELTLTDIENYGDLGDGNWGVVDDLCPTLPEGGVTNNVRFIAFIAWCEDLTLDIFVTRASSFANN